MDPQAEQIIQYMLGATDYVRFVDLLCDRQAFYYGPDAEGTLPEWAKEDGGRPKPTHTLRSKAAASAAAAAVTKSADGGVAGTEADSADDDDGDEAGAVDAYELADAVNGLSKVPKSFASDLEASKWSVRRDALQAAHILISL